MNRHDLPLPLDHLLAKLFLNNQVPVEVCIAGCVGLPVHQANQFVLGHAVQQVAYLHGQAMHRFVQGIAEFDLRLSDRHRFQRGGQYARWGRETRSTCSDNWACSSSRNSSRALAFTWPSL